MRTAVRLRGFVAYGAVSVVALALELAVLHSALAAHIFQPLAVSCGYLCSAVFQFCALRYLVFKSTGVRVALQAFSYVVGQVALWLILVVAVALLTSILPIDTMQARLICVPSLFPVNYLVSKYFIFRN